MKNNFMTPLSGLQYEYKCKGGGGITGVDALLIFVDVTWSESSRCRTRGSWVQYPFLPVSIWMSIVPARGRVSLLRGAP